MPFLPALRSVTANTSATSAFLPVVMNCLTPLSTHSSPTRSARVRIAEASEPACGSVRQKQPRSSPRASCGSHQFFCASLPKLRIGPQTTEFCTARMVEHAPSPAAISSSTIASETWSRPAPPQRSGTQTPKSPSGPISFSASRGNADLRSHSAACGASRLRANARTVSRICSCSGVSSIGSRGDALLEHPQMAADERRRDHQRIAEEPQPQRIVLRLDEQHHLAEDERDEADRESVGVLGVVREPRGDVAAERGADEPAGEAEQLEPGRALDDRVDRLRIARRPRRARRRRRSRARSRRSSSRRRRRRSRARPRRRRALARVRRVADRRAGRRVRIGHRVYAISSATAVASPPPMQRLAMPRLPPYFRSAPMSVTMIRAPDAPIG